MPATWDDRAAKVRDAFVHAYRGYMQYAAPNDELKPLSNGNINKFDGSFCNHAIVLTWIS